MPSTPSLKSSTSSEPVLPAEDWKKLLYDLLATIHRDGGQYTHLAGFAVSYTDAEAKVRELYQERASMKRKLGSMMFGSRKV